MSSGHGVVRLDLLERPIKNISDHGGSQSQFAQRTIENNWNHGQSIWVEYLLTAFSAEHIFIYICEQHTGFCHLNRINVKCFLGFLPSITFWAEYFYILVAQYQCLPYWMKMYCQGLQPLHFDTWDYQRRNMMRKLTLFLDADLIYVSWIITPMFAPSTLMKNWSRENDSDGHGSNPVQVYASILSITLFNNSGTVWDMVKYFSSLVEFTCLVH